MYDNLFPITAPVSGRVITNTGHSSAIASNQLFGVGPVIEVSGNHAVAPMAGVVTAISSSGDFIQIEHSSKAVITLILGQGRQFTHHPALSRCIRLGQAVVAGDRLLTINQTLLRAEPRQQRHLMVLLQADPDLGGWQWPEQGAVSSGESRLFQHKEEN